VNESNESNRGKINGPFVGLLWKNVKIGILALFPLLSSLHCERTNDPYHHPQQQIIYTLSIMDDKKSSKSAGRVLLPTNVIPTNYDLKLTPDLEKFTFEGIVKIDMTTSADSKDDSKQITLHAKELLFHSAQYSTADGTVVAAEEVS
jgi:hypothetical protein